MSEIQLYMPEIPFPDKKYTVILADPPWQYRDKAKAGKRGAESHYPCMSLERLCALPVHEIAARDCALVMWWVGPMSAEALRLLEAWGFRLVNMTCFTWVKHNAETGKFAFGMGNYTRGNAENALLAVNGKPTVVDRGVSQLVAAPRQAHSQKPVEVHRRIERLFGDVPRIELFARRPVPGWDVWGNEV